MLLPRARQDKLLSEAVGNDLMVYDEERHHAHSLNQTAALVWQHCDGKTTIADMAALLHDKLNLPADEKLVSLAVQQLDKARLLQDRPTQPARASRTAGFTRREMLGTLALAGMGALLAPLVTSIIVPTMQDAATPPGGYTCINQGRGQPCNGSCAQGQSCGGQTSGGCYCV